MPPWPTAPTGSLGVCVEVVGESFYPDGILHALAGADTRDVVAVLWPDPANPHDPMAVAVYVDGQQIGHLSRADARAHRDRVLAGYRSGQWAAVPARVFAGDDDVAGWVVLEPALAGRLSRLALTEILSASGFRRRRGEREGFTMRDEGDRWKVFWSASDGPSRDLNVPAMAKALRVAGYTARVVREHGYPFVSVTG